MVVADFREAAVVIGAMEILLLEEVEGIIRMLVTVVVMMAAFTEIEEIERITIITSMEETVEMATVIWVDDQTGVVVVIVDLMTIAVVEVIAVDNTMIDLDSAMIKEDRLLLMVVWVWSRETTSEEEDEAAMVHPLFIGKTAIQVEEEEEVDTIERGK